MIPREKFSHLAALPFFHSLDSTTLDDLSANLQWVSLAGGEILFRAGDAGDSMYVVLSGRLRVSVARGDGTEEVIREIARGDSVGELALLTG